MIIFIILLCVLYAQERDIRLIVKVSLLGVVLVNAPPIIAIIITLAAYVYAAEKVMRE